MADGNDEGAVQRAVAEVTEVIDVFPAWHAQALLAGRREKLGLQRSDAALDEADTALAEDWLALMQAQRVDFTLGWRRLADAAEGDEAPLRALLREPSAADGWLARWRSRCAQDDAGRADAPDALEARHARAARMRRANPWIIARNHRVEEALAAASAEGDLGPFEALLEALRTPFDEVAAHARYAEPAPAEVTACYQTFCGT